MSNAIPAVMKDVVCLPALPRVGYRRQTFSKLFLLALSVFLLLRLSRLLFRTGTGTGTA